MLNQWGFLNRPPSLLEPALSCSSNNSFPWTLSDRAANQASDTHQTLRLEAMCGSATARFFTEMLMNTVLFTVPSLKCVCVCVSVSVSARAATSSDTFPALETDTCCHQMATRGGTSHVVQSRRAPTTTDPLQWAATPPRQTTRGPVTRSRRVPLIWRALESSGKLAHNTKNRRVQLCHEGVRMSQLLT